MLTYSFPMTVDKYLELIPVRCECVNPFISNCPSSFDRCLGPILKGEEASLCLGLIDTSENNLKIRHRITKYLKESCSFEEHHSIKYFLKIAFVREISPK